MGNTPRYGWAYPESFDPPATNLHIRDALLGAEATVGALDDAVAAAYGIEVRANAVQNIPASNGANKLTFGSVTQPAAGGTGWSGNNTVTIPVSGRYHCYASASTAFASGNNFGVGIHGIAAPSAGTPWLASPLFSNGQTDSFASVTRWFAAGTQLCAWIYNNGAAFALNPSTFKPAEFIVWKVA
ncbi:hypothetical protein [Amycolatopsis solani]|uniref:hypothetical protein n=1 Tax=Amycolatopsis solani TaxID=3028615 RepID=UPI0025B1F87E|nr:hypothetical protein [Amycolatopsis sp. MEP2-6]